jgi:hypothetical protein
MMDRLNKFVAILLALTFTFTSCSDDDEATPETPPEIPPVGSMLMDFSNFEQDGGGRTTSAVNWASAAVIVGVWNVAIGVTLAVPVAAFAASINQTPAYDTERKVWVWSFDYDFVGRTYTAELTGKLIEDGVEWKMYISQEDGFQDFLWYTGQMDTGGTYGYWLLNRSPERAVEFLRIDWEKEGEGIGSIKYTDITEGSEGNGSYIEYGKNANTDFNTFYNLYGAKEDESISIEWNDTTGAGRIQINDGDFQCWDENFQDVDCG